MFGSALQLYVEFFSFVKCLPICFGRHRTLGVRQRQDPSTASIKIPPSAANNGSQRLHNSSLSTYPVSIRQQLAIIKQMEHPMQVSVDSSSASSQLRQTNIASPGLSKKRISKVHKKNERGETSLHVAARKGEYRLCRRLIEEGALVNARDYAGWTPLHEACYHGHFRIAKLLLGYDANVNALSDCDGTPLHDAVTSGNEKLVWLLLHAGAIRDRVDSDGRKPIDICHPEYNGIRNLLSNSIIPELYPVDRSPSLSPSSPNHRQRSSQMLTVNLIQLTPEKPCLTSPNSDDSVASAKALSRERNIGISDNLRMQLQESCSQPITDDTVGNTEARDFDDVILRNKEMKTEIHHNFDDIDSSFSMHCSLWSKERANTPKIVGPYTDSSSYEFDDPGLTSSHVSFESACFGISNELKEAEIRHLGHPRDTITYTERFLPQCFSQKSIYNEKRKQRGRRRGRGISTTAGSTIITTQTSPSHDVYEFRSSPESEKTGSAEDMEQELSESPSLKRQRFTQTGITNVASLTSTKISSQTNITQDDISIMEKGEALDMIPNVSDLTDEKGDATVGRKVPPLRISLPRTPIEDNIAVANAMDDVTSITTSVVRRNTRNTKILTRRHQSPEQSINNSCDENVQRMTRSKLRQSGRQLRDHPAVNYETSAKRRSSSWRRNSTTIASLMHAPLAATSDEQTISNNVDCDRVDADESSRLEAAALKEDENTLLALLLMKKNSYEGFRDFRSVIEERWAKDATEKTIVPENPPNFNNYLVVKGNYISANSLDSLSFQEKVDVVLMNKLTVKLHTLLMEQQEKRRNMYYYHQVERERLRIQAESEVMRMLTRKANERHGSFSAMRVIREANLFNTGFLEVKPRNLPVMEISEIKMRYGKLAEIMRRRQQMEADALYAEQIFMWNAAVQRSEDTTLSNLKNAVPHLLVGSLILNF